VTVVVMVMVMVMMMMMMMVVVVMVVVVRDRTWHFGLWTKICQILTNIHDIWQNCTTRNF